MPASQQAIGTAKQYQLQHRCSVERTMVPKRAVRQHSPSRGAVAGPAQAMSATGRPLQRCQADPQGSARLNNTRLRPCAYLLQHQQLQQDFLLFRDLSPVVKRRVEDGTISKLNLNHQRSSGVRGALGGLNESLTLAPLKNRPFGHIEAHSGGASNDLAQFMINNVRGDHAGPTGTSKPKHSWECVSDQAAGQV